MSFGKRFERGKIPAWEDYYVSYHILSNLVLPYYELAKLHSNENKNEEGKVPPELPEKELKKLTDFAILFKKTISEDLEKLLSFYIIRLFKILTQWKKLRINVAIYRQHQKKIKKRANYKYVFIFKTSFQTVIKNARLLLQYTTMNLEALKKVLKQQNEAVSLLYSEYKFHSGLDKYLNEIKAVNLRSRLNNYIYVLENEYMDFFKGNEKKVLSELKSIVRGDMISRQESGKLGFFFGITFLLIIICIFVGSDVASDQNLLFTRVFPIFAGMLILTLYMWLLALNIIVWRTYHVNYKLVFGFNYHHNKIYQLLRAASNFSIVILVCVLWYLVLDGSHGNIARAFDFIPKEVVPVLPWLIFVAYLLFPHRRVFNGQGRLYFFKLVKDILTSPFRRVSFAAAWATDQFVSFAIPLKDIEYVFCFYINKIQQDELGIDDCRSSRRALRGVVVVLVPLTFRCIQCLRDVYDGSIPKRNSLINFAKYLSSIAVVILSYMIALYSNAAWPYIAWGSAAIVSATYNHIWDLKMDWGFLKRHSKHRFLRDRLSYNKPVLYYIPWATNFIMRLISMLSISSPAIAQIIYPELFSLIVGMVEIVRRAIWNFLKVENAHLKNLGDFDVILETELPFVEENFPEPYDEEEFKNDLKSVLKNDKKFIRPVNHARHNAARDLVAQLLENFKDLDDENGKQVKAYFQKEYKEFVRLQELSSMIFKPVMIAAGINDEEKMEEQDQRTQSFSHFDRWSKDIETGKAKSRQDLEKLQEEQSKKLGQGRADPQSLEAEVHDDDERCPKDEVHDDEEGQSDMEAEGNEKKIAENEIRESVDNLFISNDSNREDLIQTRRNHDYGRDLDFDQNQKVKKNSERGYDLEGNKLYNSRKGRIQRPQIKEGDQENCVPIRRNEKLDNSVAKFSHNSRRGYQDGTKPPLNLRVINSNKSNICFNQNKAGEGNEFRNLFCMPFRSAENKRGIELVEDNRESGKWIEKFEKKPKNSRYKDKENSHFVINIDQRKDEKNEKNISKGENDEGLLEDYKNNSQTKHKKRRQLNDKYIPKKYSNGEWPSEGDVSYHSNHILDFPTNS